MRKNTPNPQGAMIREDMRGEDHQQNHVFSYLSPEMRVRPDHPLRAIRAMVDEVLNRLSRRFDGMYAKVGRPSIAPEKLLRAQLLQMLYSIRSERLLMEEMDYNLLFRWFVGLNADDPVWDATVFTKNRDRLLQADVAKEVLEEVVARAAVKGLTSDEHFTVDGTPAGSLGQSEEYSRQERETTTTPGRSRQSDGELSRGTALEPDACVEDRPRNPDDAQRRGQKVQVELQRQPTGGKPEWTDCERGSVCGEWNRGTGCGAGDVGADPGEKAGDGGGRQKLRHARFCGGVSSLGSDSACRTELATEQRERD